MKMQAPAGQLQAEIYTTTPGARVALYTAQNIRAQLLPWQAAALFKLTLPYDIPGAMILEIGTGAGYSTAIIAQATPSAHIMTLNTNKQERLDSLKALSPWRNIQSIGRASWDFLDSYRGPFLNMIFVDGDHKRVARDLPWWDWVAPGGLMLFHDYSKTQCPPVYDALNKWRDELGQPFDVLLVDSDEIGMVGFYKGGTRV